MNYWVMSHFQELLSIYKIEFWCELRIYWENVDLCFGQKYTLMSRLGGGEWFKI